MNALHHLLVVMLLLSGTLHAYGACPEGQYPASLPGKPPVCKPIPVLHWGAIAADIPNGNAGTSAGLLNRQQAEQAAVADCKSKGMSQCTAQIAYGNGCAALVTNGSAFFSSADVTKAFATEAATKKCGVAGGACKLVIASCSTAT